MNNFLLALDVDPSKPIEGFVDKFLFGGQMLLVGMISVFLVLGIIFLALSLFNLAFNKSEKKSSESVSPVVTHDFIEAEPQFDGEVIAAIACAIALAESEKEGAKFRVVSFKKR